MLPSALPNFSFPITPTLVNFAYSLATGRGGVIPLKGYLGDYSPGDNIPSAFPLAIARVRLLTPSFR